MNISVKRIALGFAFSSFFFMVIGSIIKGTTALTAVIRGFEGAFIFGILAWIITYYLLKKEQEPVDMK